MRCRDCIHSMTQGSIYFLCRSASLWFEIKDDNHANWCDDFKPQSNASHTFCQDDGWISVLDKNPPLATDIFVKVDELEMQRCWVERHTHKLNDTFFSGDDIYSGKSINIRYWKPCNIKTSCCCPVYKKCSKPIDYVCSPNRAILPLDKTPYCFEPKDDSWISVLDELPKIGTKIKAQYKCGVISSGILSKIVQAFENNKPVVVVHYLDDSGNCYYITHWKPLPEKPFKIKYDDRCSPLCSDADSRAMLTFNGKIIPIDYGLKMLCSTLNDLWMSTSRQGDKFKLDDEQFPNRLYYGEQFFYLQDIGSKIGRHLRDWLNMVLESISE